MSDDVVPTRREIAKLPREKCPLCGITQAKPAMENGRCRSLVACEMRRRRKAQRRQENPKP